MVIAAPGHYLTHNTRMDLPKHDRIPIDSSIHLGLREKKINYRLLMPLRTVLARVVIHVIHKHKFITTVQSARWEYARRGRNVSLWGGIAGVPWPRVSSDIRRGGTDRNRGRRLGLGQDGNRPITAVRCFHIPVQCSIIQIRENVLHRKPLVPILQPTSFEYTPQTFGESEACRTLWLLRADSLHDRTDEENIRLNMNVRVVPA